jgi:arylsulfatase A-like enzyme/HEAT repeat protein
MDPRSATLTSVRDRLAGAWVDAAAVVIAWAACGLAENVAVGLLWPDQFSGAWEVELGRRLVVPVAIAFLAPISLVACLVFRSAQRAASHDLRVATGLAMAGGFVGGALGYGVTAGRHFASWGWRVAFIALMVAVGAWSLGAFLPRLLRVLRHPASLAVLGMALAVTAWLSDSYVLARLYPAFHSALFAVLLFGAAIVAFAFRGNDSPGRLAVACAAGVTAFVAIEWLSLPRAIHAIEQRSNLRIALVEHAPIAGRAVEIVSALRHEVPEASHAQGRGGTEPEETARTLDWSGRDIVLLSIDALRADHVSAYGYGRPTTPNIDALALEGTLFQSAYCPTPHTSYSVTSMLTGKYMRPLLALGLGGDSETWPQDLRRYDYRTAAFYPPAVFFIDQQQFRYFESTQLGFEYSKVEFADPALRERQVDEYLRGAPAGVSLFLWVHFFEPHEPYVMHPDHVFSGGTPPEIDAYDSEVATADDGVGRIVRLVRGHRPGAVFIVTADHGEEFGEHGGRYHGTTVYEEQVRVPLVVGGPGVRRGAREGTVVQTIDLLPTVLSALGIPRPARVRGRDLGPLLAGAHAGDRSPLSEVGFAFAETDDYALIASGDVRLVCERRAAACALYRPLEDPLERHDLAQGEVGRFAQLRATLRSIELEFGRYERGDGRTLPEALRRGIQGDVEAAVDVAALLDDADVTIRRKAAEVCFELRSADPRAALRRAATHDEDAEVRRWSRLALVRLGDEPPDSLDDLRKDKDVAQEWRRRAALARAERGDGAGCDELGAWWADVLPAAGLASADGEPPRLLLDLGHIREILAAAAKARCRTMVPALVRGLSDVRARPYVADVLGVLGDDRAREPLLGLLASETNVTSRAREARALLSLGARSWASPVPSVDVHVKLAVPRGSQRALVLLSDAAATLDVMIDGTEVPAGSADSPVRSIDLPAGSGPTIRFDARAGGGSVIAIWVVPAGPN